MAGFIRLLTVPLLGALLTTTALAQGAITDIGTPRDETLIVQTFDGRSQNPGSQNPLNSYALWHGFRELGWSYLWEMDTATGKSYPELADGFPEVLDKEHRRFRVKIRQGVFWSDGVEFTADDIIYTLDTIAKYKDKLTNVPVISGLVKSFKKIDKYTFEVETTRSSYDFVTRFGVNTFVSAFVPVPKHIFEPLGESVVTFENTNAVTLGPYKIKQFDPNGFWQLWERRDDWQRSGWGNLGEPKPKYVYYKDFGTEETRALAFVQNQYDIDTFMSPDTIQAAEARNPAIQTFSAKFPYHDMNDACAYGIYFNQQKAPYDKPEVRWALALTLDLQQVGLSALSGQFKAGALPIADTQINGPIYYEPLKPFLEGLALKDGYKPFDSTFGQALVKTLVNQGVDAAQLPSDDAVRPSFGMGWWKHDPAEAARLLESVGIKKGGDGFYTLPGGSPWSLELVIPGEWNKVMQRMGFSVADSWRQAGFNVNARQVESGEFDTIEATNARNELQLDYSSSCVYNANWLRAWSQINPKNVKPADSTETLGGNFMRVTDKRILDLVDQSQDLPLDSSDRLKNGLQVAKHLVEDMQVINLMNIPTTIPTNSTYWTNYSKQNNFYAAPYTWWSSFKKTVVNIKPTGQQ